MDPLYVSAHILGIAAACVCTTKALNDISGKSSGAPSTVAAICSESSKIGASLLRLQHVALSRPMVLAGKGNDEQSPMRSALDIVLTGCMVSFSCFDDEVSKLSRGRAPGRDTSANIGFTWNKANLRRLLSQLRDCSLVTTLVISALQLYVFPSTSPCAPDLEPDRRAQPGVIEKLPIRMNVKNGGC